MSLVSYTLDFVMAKIELFGILFRLKSICDFPLQLDPGFHVQIAIMIVIEKLIRIDWESILILKSIPDYY